MNGVICILGESFRFGGQGSRVTGVPDSIPEQELACKTHLHFFNAIKDRITLKVKLLTYDTQYNNKLVEWYKDYTPETVFIPSPIGYDNLFKKSIEAIKTESDIDFVMFIRIDLVLKNQFLINFDEHSTNIRYPSACWVHSPLPKSIPHHKTFSTNRDRVNDTFMYVPKKHIDNLFNGEILLTHEACDIMSPELYESVNFFIDTYHDSDSQKDRNPLYKIGNRPESNTWHSPNLKLGVDPIQDDTKTYDNIFINDQYLL